MAESIKQQEQQRMDRVVAQIKKAQKKAQKNIATAKSDTQAIQDDFKNNLRIKTGTYSGMMETALTVRQQQQQLAERENNKTQAAKRLDVLEKMEQKPYFARVDIKEQGEQKQEKLYIGLASFSDEKDRFLVYD